MTFISIFALMGFMVFLTAIIAVCSISIDAITKAELAKDAKAYKQTIQATHDAFIKKWEEAQQINIAIIDELNSFDNLINQRANELKEILAAKRKHQRTHKSTNHKMMFA